jgi:hypothetical protein
MGLWSYFPRIDTASKRHLSCPRLALEGEPVCILQPDLEEIRNTRVRLFDQFRLSRSRRIVVAISR